MTLHQTRVPPVTEDFLSTLVHELRQPLSTIDACVYMMDVVLPPTEVRAREQLNEIARQLDWLQQILDSAAQGLAPSRDLTNEAMAAVT